MKYNFSGLMDGVSASETTTRNSYRNNNHKSKDSTLSRIDFGSFNLDSRSFSFSSRKKDAPQKKEVNPSNESKMELEKTMMEEFVTEYTENKTNVSALYNLLQTEFPFVADILANKYLSKKYADLIPSMNAVIKLMTTKVFATSLLSTIKDEAFDLDEVKYNFGKTISLVLRTSNSKMVDSTMSAYVEIMADYLYSIELKQLQELGVTDDVATDIVIGIPKLMTQMSEFDLKYSVGEYLGIIMEHCDTTIDTMDAESQKKLFYTIFPQLNGQTNKAVGKCLVMEAVNMGKDEKRAALYEEYQKMLYMILDEQDIQDIEYVLKFIVKTVKSSNEDDKNKAAILFDGKKASEYKNINKALKNFVSDNKDAKEILFQ